MPSRRVKTRSALENQAEAYANEVLPQARGEAARIIADARAYRDQVIARSEGETARFTAILTEYLMAPEVTRQRLYLETMEQVLGDSNKVIIDVEDGGNSLLYLPIDQLMKQRPPEGP
jgi:modulator of FtsH protease HflK